MSDDFVVGGDKMRQFNRKGMGAFFGGVFGIIILIATILIIFLDLALGPAFLLNQAEAKSVEVSYIRLAVPIGFSLATTGILYALLDGQRGKAGGIITLLGYIIGVSDTFLDVGGLNSILAQDPSASQRIFLPWSTIHTTPVFWFFDLLVFVFCLGQEILLGEMLKRMRGMANQVVGEGIGGWIEAYCVWFAGVVYSLAKVISVSWGALAMFGLDYALTVMLSDDGASMVRYLILSTLIGGLQLMMWRSYRHIKNVNPENVKIKNMTPRQLLGFGAVLILSVIDTGFDVAGFNNTIFGTSRIVIDDPSLGWILVICIVAVMCTASEHLAAEIFWGKTKDSGYGSMGGAFAGTSFGGVGGMSGGMPLSGMPGGMGGMSGGGMGGMGLGGMGGGLGGMGGGHDPFDSHGGPPLH
jgi:hypothetical protein